jgi:hypothetical protein
MGFWRPLCATERYYLAYSDIFPDFTIQFFFEGSGTFDVPRWKEAVEAGSRANPGSRLVLKGSWRFSRWVDSGITPPVRVVDASAWDGTGPDGAPACMTEHFNPRTGPTCEVVLMQGTPLRAVFRAHHCVMDGRGIITWAEDIFRALRGEQPLGTASKLTEFQVARRFQKGWRTPPPHEFIAPTGMPQGSEQGVVWRHMRFAGRRKNLIGQVAVIMAQSAWSYGEGKVRFGIPVDLRPRIPGLRSTGNLSNLVYLEMEPGTSASDAAQSIAWQLQERKDGMQYWGDQLIRYLPIWYLRRIIRDEAALKHVTGRYRNSGIISNMGVIPLELFQGGGFTADYFWGLPPCPMDLPFFMGVVSSGDNSSLIFVLPKTLASGGRLEEIMERLRTGLVPVHDPGKDRAA